MSVESIGCPSENALLEYADGIADAAGAGNIERHIDDCQRCRRVLAELARTEEPPRTSAVPVELLGAYLRADAPRRESIAARVVASLALLSIAVVLLVPPPHPSGFAEATLAIQGGLFVYETTVYLLLRRGWFHPLLPLVASLVEVSMVFAMRLAGLYTLGPEAVQASPAVPLIGAIVVFSAIRLEPRICLAAGVVAAIEWAVVSVAMVATLPPVEAAKVPPAGPYLGSIFLVIAGAGGAVLARYLVTRAEEALRAIREQDLFGKYSLGAPIGSGGMGQVFLATYCPEGGFTKRVAVKRVRPEIAERPELIEAFREEARLAATLAHPNIVQVFDFGRFRGSYMLAMEYVDGISLAALLRRRPLELAVVAYVGAELAAALDHLHGRRDSEGAPLDLVHRDVNPPNVLLSHIGEVKLADFGIARIATLKASFAGKTAYAAPEQLRGDTVDARTDLYALGLTLHEALSGEPVFAQRDEDALRTPIRPPSLLRPDVPPELERIVMDLLRADASERPARAADVRERLLALTDSAAPYPRGATLLARAVEDAMKPANRVTNKGSAKTLVEG